jgi:hypothetical protein
MKFWLALAAVALAAPASARAQFFFDNYCISGAFPVCASVRLFASGNNLTMQVWNLEGSFGTPHTITAIGLYHSGASWTGTVNSYAVNYVTSSGSTDITSRWRRQWANDISTLGGVSVEIAEGTSGNSGINGCVQLPGGTKWLTCNSFAAAPYVQFDFSLSQAFSLENVELRWHSQQVGPDLELSLKCDTGGAGDYPPCTVVPEPVTLALLGSGLAGIGGVDLIRRRRKLDIRDS